MNLRSACNNFLASAKASTDTLKAEYNARIPADSDTARVINSAAEGAAGGAVMGAVGTAVRNKFIDEDTSIVKGAATGAVVGAIGGGIRQTLINRQVNKTVEQVKRELTKATYSIISSSGLSDTHTAGEPKVVVKHGKIVGAQPHIKLRDDFSSVPENLPVEVRS